MGEFIHCLRLSIHWKSGCSFKHFIRMKFSSYKSSYLFSFERSFAKDEPVHRQKTILQICCKYLISSSLRLKSLGLTLGALARCLIAFSFLFTFGRIGIWIKQKAWKMKKPEKSSEPLRSIEAKFSGRERIDFHVFASSYHAQDYRLFNSLSFHGEGGLLRWSAPSKGIRVRREFIPSCFG